MKNPHRVLSWQWHSVYSTIPISYTSLQIPTDYPCKSNEFPTLTHFNLRSRRIQPILCLDLAHTRTYLDKTRPCPILTHFNYRSRQIQPILYSDVTHTSAILDKSRPFSTLTDAQCLSWQMPPTPTYGKWKEIPKANLCLLRNKCIATIKRTIQNNTVKKNKKE